MRIAIMGIIYWGLMIAVYALMSPLIIATAAMQVFKDVGFWNIIKTPLEGWKQLQQNIADEATSKAAKIPDYLDTLPYAIKQEYKRIIAREGYEPLTDPHATYHKYPYNPSFTLPANDDLRNNLENKWRDKALSITKHPYFTKSYWEAVGSQKIYELFIEPYRVPEIETIEIYDHKEHRWVLETWSLPYYEVEYQLEMLRWIYNVNPNIVKTNREYTIRYKLLLEMHRRLERLHGKFRAEFDKVDRKIMAGGGYNIIDGMWDLYFANKQFNLFLDQCDYFKHEARKAKHG